MARTAVLRAVTTKLAQAPLRAASIPGSDPDANLSDTKWYRKLGSQATRDLTAASWADTLRRAFDFLDHHPVGNRYASIMREWILCGDYNPVAVDERVQEVVEAFWTDPFNAWDVYLSRYVDVMIGAGELFLPVKASRSGRVVVDYIDPACVVDAKLRDGSTRLLDALEYAIPGTTKTVWLKVVQPVTDPESDLFGRLIGFDPRQPMEGVSGVLAFRWNCRPNSTRGRSDFLASMDPLATLDDYHASEAEKAQMLSRIIGDVEVDGSDSDVTEVREQISTAPWYASMPVHNTRVKYNLQAPSTGAADADARERMLRLYGATPLGIPPHILSGDISAGGTRAVAMATNDPAYLRGKQKQEDLARVIKVSCQYAVDTAYILNPERFRGVEDWTIDIETPPLLRPDPTQGAPVLATATVALIQALSEQLISRDSARKVFVQLLEAAGAQGITLEDVEAELLQQGPQGLDPETRERVGRVARELADEEASDDQ